MTVDWGSCPIEGERVQGDQMSNVNTRDIDEKGTERTHLAKRTIELLVQCPQPQRTHVARPMVARRQGIVLDGFGAYPADGRVVVGSGAVGAGGGGGLGGLVGDRGRSIVCRLYIVIAAAFVVGFVTGLASASTPAVSTPFAVLRWTGASFGRRRGRHGCVQEGGAT
jgi:hypothetical protein